MTGPKRQEALFLDTTIQVDRVILEENAQQRHRIDELLDGTFTITCSFSRLEYKRVVIQNLALLLQYIVDGGLTFAMEKISRLQHQRRPGTLLSILAWIKRRTDFGETILEGDSVDKALSRRAESYIRNAIECLWFRFDDMVDHVTDGTKCQRALERPRRTRAGSFDVTIHEKDCRKRACNNSNFFRANLKNARLICSELEKLVVSGIELTGELKDCLAIMKRAINDPDILYDYQNCLAVGDVWIHLECVTAKVQKIISTNHREGEPLCRILDLTMLNPRR